MNKFIFIVSICSFLVVQGIHINAMSPIIGGKYQNGVGRVVYWIDYSSGANYYEYLIKNAVQNWMYTGYDNPIYMYPVSSNVGSNMDFYAKTNAFWPGTSTVLGETRFFKDGGSRVNPTVGITYYYTDIYINHDTNKVRPANDVEVTLKHELGHAFGLAENNQDPYSIMAQAHTRRVFSVQKVDNDAINYLYK